jgi:alpha-mannosidase
MSTKLLIIRLVSTACAIIICQSIYSQVQNDGGQTLHAFVKKQIDLGSKADHWLEGYKKPILGESMEYRSSSPGVNDALICRATDGKMSVGWETAPFPADIKESNITFSWLCGLGVNLGDYEFTLTVNNAHPLKFRSIHKNSWTSENSDGLKLSFIAVTADAHSDLFGYMLLQIPRKMFLPQVPLNLQVTGENANSQAWFMAFKSGSVVKNLLETTRKGFWYKLNWDDNSKKIKIILPLVHNGKKVTISNRKALKLSGILKSQGDICQSVFQFRTSFSEEANFPLEITLDNTLLDRLEFSSLQQPGSAINQSRLFVTHTISQDGDHKSLEASGHPITEYDLLMKIADSRFRDGSLHLITSSHQDIAWMDDPFTCIDDRDSIVITPALKMLEERQDYSYSIEDALILKEYIERHPDRIPEINKFTLEKRLEFGATYNQPYEGLLSGEALIREIYFGRKWIKKILPGYDPRVVWNLDVPGRTMQMPQILKKSGVDYLFISRHERGLFYWRSPDGSSVGSFSPGHYHIATDFLRSNIYESFLTMPQAISSWESFYDRYSLPPSIPLLFTSDMSSPKDFTGLINLWNYFSVANPGDGKSDRQSLPRLKYDIAQNVFDTIFSKGSTLPTIQGERPGVWLYIHGPTHHYAISAAREGAILLPAAEKFSAINALLKNNMTEYPQTALSNAWESHIFPDHGWGGKGGNITDSLFRYKYEFARDEGKRLLQNAIDGITAYVKTDKNLGIPLIVYNELSWERTDPVRVNLQFDEGKAFGVSVVDEKSHEIPSELHEVILNKDGSLKSADVLFICENIPSIGYRTYYVKTLNKPRKPAVTEQWTDGTIENKYYRVKLKPGGISNIYDKELGVELFRTEKFLAGELFTMKSVGTGAGEFSEVQQPTMEGFDKLSNYTPAWKIISDGEVSTCALIEQKIPHCTYRQKITVYKSLKRIDIDAEILGWDGTKYREFRLAFPLNIDQGIVTYEVPFGSVTVGKDEIPGAAGERYVQNASEVRPREVQNWISTSDDRFGVTLGVSTAVCDYKDPTDDPISSTLIQPILLASRRSCHSEGNWYLQEGDHHYQFSLFSHTAGWNNGSRYAVQANSPLRVSIKKSSVGRPVLPPDCSFYSTSAENVIISTIKKCEDDSSIIIRCYETQGKDTHYNILNFKTTAKIVKVNLIEKEMQPLPVREKYSDIPIGHHSIETYKVWLIK